MSDPYLHIQRPSLTGIPLTVFLVTPSDSEAFPRVAKGLRIMNETTGMQMLTFVTGGGDEVTFNIPAQSLLYEDILVSAVKATGTGILVIHAYTD